VIPERIIFVSRGITVRLFLYRVEQKQLDDLNLAPCRHLCRWRGETHIDGYSGFKPSGVMQRRSQERPAFAVEKFTFFKTMIPLM